MAITFEYVGNIGGGAYYFSPVDGVGYKVPAGRYEVFAYRSTQARHVEIQHSKHGNSANIISNLSGGITTPDGVEWIRVTGADKVIFMPVAQFGQRVPGRA